MNETVNTFWAQAERLKIHEMRRLERQPKPAAGDERNTFLAERNGVYPPTSQSAMNETVNTFLAWHGAAQRRLSAMVLIQNL